MLASLATVLALHNAAPTPPGQAFLQQEADRGRCNDTWYFLDGPGSGTAVRCAPGRAALQCATRVESDGCQWGWTYERPLPYQPLLGVRTADSVIEVDCPSTWPTKDGSNACDMLRCTWQALLTPDFCRPRVTLPPAEVHSSWLFSVFVDANGELDLSDNSDHQKLWIEEALFAYVGGSLLALLLLCASVCACWCRLRRSEQALRMLTRTHAKQGYDLAQSRARSRFGRRLRGGRTAAAAVGGGTEADGTSSSTSVELPTLERPISPPRAAVTVPMLVLLPAPRPWSLPAWDVAYVEEEDEDAAPVSDQV